MRPTTPLGSWHEGEAKAAVLGFVERVTEERSVIGKHVATGLRPSFLTKFQKHSVTLPTNLFHDFRATGPESLELSAR